MGNGNAMLAFNDFKGIAKTKQLKKAMEELGDISLSELIEMCDKVISRRNFIRCEKKLKNGILKIVIGKTPYDDEEIDMLANISSKEAKRKAILLLQKEGLTQKEISELLNISASYVSHLANFRDMAPVKKY